MNPTCSCGFDDETTVHFFLFCPRYSSLRTTYLSKISDILRSDISVLPKDHLTHILMYGSNVYNDVTNETILKETINFIKKSGRFEKLEAFSWVIDFFPSPVMHTHPWQTPICTFLLFSMSIVIFILVVIVFVFHFQTWSRW